MAVAACSAVVVRAAHEHALSAIVAEQLHDHEYEYDTATAAEHLITHRVRASV
ncbi:hypothetical protein [Micromonospora craniellae]|uniref:hypothetical protein n=1 Tax=Micromonospora craniellae TaxID=2294034 RepID=UPI0013148B1D|nr:hypothetical protein [Micromonospora craniellae]QOC93775.1 hypothetical protein ID554_09160 [Micromonospora craniellae]